MDPRTPALEIKITPAMIEAGADIILGCDLEDHRARDVAEMVFKTMLSCRTHETAKSAPDRQSCYPPLMSNQANDATQQRDALLLRLLKTPPQPRPKRERDEGKPKSNPKKTGSKK